MTDSKLINERANETVTNHVRGKILGCRNAFGITYESVQHGLDWDLRGLVVWSLLKLIQDGEIITKEKRVLEGTSYVTVTAYERNWSR